MDTIFETYCLYLHDDPNLAVALTARELDLDEVEVRFALGF
ncbi:MAG: hypothetical protein QM680_07315 [Luteolibacter sp.]